MVIQIASLDISEADNAAVNGAKHGAYYWKFQVLQHLPGPGGRGLFEEVILEKFCTWLLWKKEKTPIVPTGVDNPTCLTILTLIWDLFASFHALRSNV